MSKLTTHRRQRRRVRCASCGNVIVRGESRIVLGGFYFCSTCVYWADRGVIRLEVPS